MNGIAARIIFIDHISNYEFVMIPTVYKVNFKFSFYISVVLYFALKRS